MCSLDLPHRGDSYEYTQHIIILERMENTFLNYPHLPPDLALWLTLSGSNYPYLEQISMVPKMLKPLKSDCQWVLKNDPIMNIPYRQCLSLYNAQTTNVMDVNLGPVVQSIVSLTSSLVVKCYCSSQYNI